MIGTVSKWTTLSCFGISIFNESQQNHICNTQPLYWIWSMNLTWWRHQMETISASLACCAGNSPVTGEFPSQRPVTRNFDGFFDLRHELVWGWWFETPSRSLWRQCNVTYLFHNDAWHGNTFHITGPLWWKPHVPIIWDTITLKWCLLNLMYGYQYT